MLLFAAGLCAVILIMLLMERLVKPTPTARPIFHRLSLLTALPSIMVYTTMFMISYRPIFALIATVITFAGVVIVNNAKYAALREPLVFSDFALLRQAIDHPALYVKYVGVLNIIGIVTASALAIGLGLWLEPPVIHRETLTDFFPMVSYLFVVLGMIYAVTRGPLRNPLRQTLHHFGAQTDVTQDMDKMSLVVCLIVYFFLADEPVPEKAQSKTAAPSAKEPTPAPPAKAPPPRPMGWHPAKTDALPSVVLIQSESFFDARRLHPSIPRNILDGWDAVTAVAAYRGRLTVPAWGANTMRTEFAVLSGLPNDALGVHRFNPYLSLCKRPVYTMAHQLRALGYRTVCVHPYAANFFDRDQVFPNLGFDAFVDISQFNPSESFGPYIGDRAVAERILSVLDEHDGPQFVFAITMENHGKWEPDRLDGVVPPELLDNPPLGSRELALYLAHLANADAMTVRLTDELRNRPGDAVFCLYGDHVPSLPKAFTAASYDDDRTDYVVWKKNGRYPRQVDIGADTLGRLVLDAVLNEVNHRAVKAPQNASLAS